MFSPLPELLELQELLEQPEDFLELTGQQRIAPHHPVTNTFDQRAVNLKHYLISDLAHLPSIGYGYYQEIQLRLLVRVFIKQSDTLMKKICDQAKSLV